MSDYRLISGSQDLDLFCSQVQQFLAGTKLLSNTIVHSDFSRFVKAKPCAAPLTTHQFVSYGASGQAEVISCKMLTAAAIRKAHGQHSAGQERSCSDLLQDIVDQLSAALTESGGKPEAIIVDEDQPTRSGPGWLEPWPYTAAYRDDKQRLHLRAKTMRVPMSWWIPIPARFKGTYYCHLPAPGYIKAILEGSSLPAK